MTRTELLTSRPDTRFAQPRVITEVVKTETGRKAAASNREVFVHSVDLSGERANVESAKAQGESYDLSKLNARLEADWRSLRGFLGVKEVSDISALANDEDKLAETRLRADTLMMTQYQMEAETFHEKLQDYAQLADSTVQYATRDLPPEFQEQGNASQIREVNHPVDLLVEAYTAPDRLDRFRALRKFRLIQTAAKVDLHERKAGTEEAFELFDYFINADVFDAPSNEGVQLSFMLSEHDLESERFDATKVELVTVEDLEDRGIITEDDDLLLQPGQKILPLQRRTFTTESGEQITAYIPITEQNKLTRKKSEESKMLKVERKGESVEKAVDDQVGMMVIFEHGENIAKFEDHLVARAADNGSALEFEQLEDTLTGGEHDVQSEGSSKDLQQRKSHMLMFGVRPELIEYTPEAAANNIYGNNAHRRYEVKRLLSKVIKRYFPPARYGYDFDEIEQFTRERVEAEIRHPYQVNGHRPNEDHAQVKQELVSAVN